MHTVAKSVYELYIHIHFFLCIMNLNHNKNNKNCKQEYYLSTTSTIYFHQRAVQYHDLELVFRVRSVNEIHAQNVFYKIRILKYVNSYYSKPSIQFLQYQITTIIILRHMTDMALYGKPNTSLLSKQQVTMERRKSI